MHFAKSVCDIMISPISIKSKKSRSYPLNRGTMAAYYNKSHGDDWILPKLIKTIKDPDTITKEISDFLRNVTFFFVPL